MFKFLLIPLSLICGTSFSYAQTCKPSITNSCSTTVTASAEETPRPSRTVKTITGDDDFNLILTREQLDIRAAELDKREEGLKKQAEQIEERAEKLAELIGDHKADVTDQVKDELEEDFEEKAEELEEEKEEELEELKSDLDKDRRQLERDRAELEQSKKEFKAYVILRGEQLEEDQAEFDDYKREFFALSNVSLAGGNEEEILTRDREFSSTISKKIRRLLFTVSLDGPKVDYLSVLNGLTQVLDVFHNWLNSMDKDHVVTVEALATSYLVFKSVSSFSHYFANIFTSKAADQVSRKYWLFGSKETKPVRFPKLKAALSPTRLLPALLFVTATGVVGHDMVARYENRRFVTTDGEGKRALLGEIERLQDQVVDLKQKLEQMEAVDTSVVEEEVVREEVEPVVVEEVVKPESSPAATVTVREPSTDDQSSVVINTVTLNNSEKGLNNTGEESVSEDKSLESYGSETVGEVEDQASDSDSDDDEDIDNLLEGI